MKKRLILGLFLTVAALGFLVSPAMAEADPPQKARALSAADRAFLAYLATLPISPEPAASAPAAKRSKRPPTEKALCSATASCGSYNISCEGNNSTASCTAVDRNCDVGQRGRVTCDGVTTLCTEECPGCPPGWCDDEENCAWNCYPCAYTYSCNETYCTDRCRCHFATCPP
jgi:hypothetical protein